MQNVFNKWVRKAALFIAVAFIGTSTGLAQVSVDLTDLVGRPGETGMVAVNLSDVEIGTPIVSFGFDVVTDAGVTLTGIIEEGTLSADANFNTDTGLPGLARVGGNAQGTPISTSGTLIYLVFDLETAGVGSITLTNFTFANGDPTVVNNPPTGGFIVTDRMMLVEDEVVHEDEEFSVSVVIEDALVTADDVNSFAVTVNYDPAVFTIDASKGSNGVLTAGTMLANFSINATELVPGQFKVSGFNQDLSGSLVGAGVFFQLAAIAGNEPGREGPGVSVTTLTDIEFNAAPPAGPVYGAFPGDILVLPFNVANENGPETPSEFVLDGNYPNPFNPTTNIKFDLPESAIVSVQIMDMLGREVMSIPSQNLGAGANQTIQIAAGNLTSGLYLYRVIARSQSRTDVKVGTMTLLK
jgi:hypothetical protein